MGPLVLIWKHGTRVLTAGVGAGKMHVKKDPRVTLAGTDLIVSNITESDAGEYRCELDTDDEYPLTLSHTLQILGKFAMNLKLVQKSIKGVCVIMAINRKSV